MKIEIKNVKHSAFASQETHCFQATVYVDGKRSFTAFNEGFGGCNSYQQFKDGDFKEVNAQVSKINEELNKEIIKTSFGEIRNDLDIVIGDLLNEFLAIREVKQQLRSIVYVLDGNLYAMPPKLKPTKENIQRVRDTDWWDEKAVILNELSLEDAIDVYKTV